MTDRLACDECEEIRLARKEAEKGFSRSAQSAIDSDLGLAVCLDEAGLTNLHDTSVRPPFFVEHVVRGQYLDGWHSQSSLVMLTPDSIRLHMLPTKRLRARTYSLKFEHLGIHTLRVAFSTLHLRTGPKWKIEKITDHLTAQTISTTAIARGARPYGG